MSSIRTNVSGNRARGAATICFIGGVVALVALGLVVGADLKPNTDSTAALSVWILAAAVLIFGMLRGLVDLRNLSAEWSALDLVVENNSDAAKRNLPATAVARRIMLVDEAVEEQRADREFRHSNRALALAKLSGIGNITRFASSALLILVVIGTFAGMRYALPLLSKAIQTAASAAQGGSGGLGTGDITKSLEIVSEAVGSNLLALFGSLVLSLVAFGASFERRELLTSIEFLSERWLYRRLPVDADATELQKAVNELQRSVKEVAAVSVAVGQLGSGISDLKFVLKDTIGEMRDAFSESVNQHGARMQQQLNDAIGELTATLGVTSIALQSTAVSYEGLVKGLQERDLGVRAAADALAEHSNRLTVVQERASSATVGAASAIENAAQVLSKVEQLSAHAVDQLTQSATQLLNAVDARKEQLRTLDVRMVAIAEQQRLAFEAADSARAGLRSSVDEGVTSLRLAISSQATQLDALVDQSRASGQAAAVRAAELRTTYEKGVGSLNAEAATRSKESLAATVDQMQRAAREISSAQEHLAATVAASVRESAAQLIGANQATESNLRSTLELQGERTSLAIDNAATRTVNAMAETHAGLKESITNDRSRMVELMSSVLTKGANGSTSPVGSAP